MVTASGSGRKVDFEGLLIAEKINKPLGSHDGCAEGGDHGGEAGCENERAEKTANTTAEMRYTMVSTGLVLL